MNDTQTLPDPNFTIPEPPSQLSFRVGGEAVGHTIFGTLAINGKLKVDQDLNLGDELRVQVVNSMGELVAGGPAFVSTPGFREKKDKYGEIIAIERVHKAEVE